MTIIDFSRKYFGPTKFAEPFIKNDKIADVAELNPGAPQSNNIINPEYLATSECAADFARLLAPFYPSLRIADGPVMPPYSADFEAALQHMTTSGPRKAAWLTFFGFNQFNAGVNPHMLAGPLVAVFGRYPAAGAFAYILGQMNFAALLEPSPTE